MLGDKIARTGRVRLECGRQVQLARGIGAIEADTDGDGGDVIVGGGFFAQVGEVTGDLSSTAVEAEAGSTDIGETSSIIAAVVVDAQRAPTVERSADVAKFGRQQVWLAVIGGAAEAGVAWWEHAWRNRGDDGNWLMSIVYRDAEGALEQGPGNLIDTKCDKRNEGNAIEVQAREHCRLGVPHGSHSSVL